MPDLHWFGFTECYIANLCQMFSPVSHSITENSLFSSYFAIKAYSEKLSSVITKKGDSLHFLDDKKGELF